MLFLPCSLLLLMRSVEADMLCLFLQALHEKKAANPDHTTLLLSCYTKLKDQNQIDTFISADWTFSAETAIVVCRQAGYSAQALAIAKKHKEHEWVVKLLVDDFKQNDAALTYLRAQPTNFVSTCLLALSSHVH
jgi:hypothetical protein